MTKALTDRVEETYKQVFGDTIAEPDRERISFLRDVVTGKVDYGNERLPLDEADGFVEHEKNELIDDVQEVENKKQKKDMLDEIANLDDTLYRFDAVRVMRKWYLKEEYNDKDGAKLEAIQPLYRAGLSQIVESFYDCLEVLKKQGVNTLLEPFYAAFKLKKNRDKTIGIVAESLIQKGIPEITDKIVDKMSAYNRHMECLLDFAILEQNDRAVKMAVRRMTSTGIPELQKYAEERMKTYKAE